MSNLLSELDAVVGLADKATPGEWAQHPMAPSAVHQPSFECWIPQTPDDAALIAAAVNLFRTHHAEIAADAKDAARYRWLRDRVGVSHNGPMLPCGTWKLDDADKRATDAEIDKHIAAMSARDGE